MSDHEKVQKIDSGVIRRVLVARYQYALAADQGRQHGDAALMTAIGTLQDSAEHFLNAAADHLKADTKARSEFDKLFNAVDAKLNGKLPHRLRMVAMNKARVQSKHHGVRPDRTEVEEFTAIVQRFFEEVSVLVFEVPLYAINLISQIKQNEIREHLTIAQAEFDSGRFSNTLIECRKAMYLAFERYGNINSDAYEGVLYWPRYAPDYARQPSHLHGAKEPSEFIELDHQKVDADLVALGLDPVVFWSIMNMTPKMFRHPDRGWLVRSEFHVHATHGARDRAAYVLDNTVNFLLRWEGRTASRRYAPFFGSHDFIVTAETTTVYRHADRESEPLGVLKRGDKVNVLHGTPGLKEDTLFGAIFLSALNPVESLPGLGVSMCYVVFADIKYSPPATDETSTPTAT